ncbi:hypothetical protein C7974DRAFT_376563 [Boeremia exigua]|uniref:uncharacterized protein n=1 Tax=Boeremia exigua TaxID=749465 RepID=UPI001E8EDB8B|nr:uncharacterized protein C7974DRAFT_376563 [Boeremia exigua]KAH6629764.1 hypothetical protein C7974DRAFT_376563 [Boeremia exigua]
MTVSQDRQFVRGAILWQILLKLVANSVNHKRSENSYQRLLSHRLVETDGLSGFRKFLDQNRHRRLSDFKREFSVSTMGLLTYIVSAPPRGGESSYSPYNFPRPQLPCSQHTTTANIRLNLIRKLRRYHPHLYKQSLKMAPRKRNNTKKHERGKKISKNAIMTLVFVGDTSSLFFKSPLELRNQIYDFLWQTFEMIKVWQRSSKTYITAYLNDDMKGIQEDFRQLCKEQPQWPSSCLPRWLLTNKLILREGMARFSSNSHWILHSVRSVLTMPGPFHPMSPATIMLPGLARSLDLGPFGYKHSFLERDDRFVLHFGKRDRKWLKNLTRCLTEYNAVEHVSLTIQYVHEPAEGYPATVDLQPLQNLLYALPRLLSISVSIATRTPCRFDRTWMDGITLTELERVVAAVIGETDLEVEVSERVVSHGYFFPAVFQDQTFTFTKA